MSHSAEQSAFRASVASDLENPKHTLIELRILWENTVLRVLHLAPTQPFVLARKGLEKPHSLVIDAPELAAMNAPWTLIAHTTDGPTLMVPPGAAYRVQRADLGDTLETPARAETLDGVTKLPLQRTQIVECTVGGLSFQCRLVFAAKHLRMRQRRDRAMLVASVVSAALVASVLTLSWRASWGRDSLLSDDFDQDRLAELIDTTSRAHNAMPQTWDPAPGMNDLISPRGNDPRPRGQTGAFEAPRRQARSAIQQRTETPEQAQLRLRAAVQARGIFAAIGSDQSQLGNSAPDSPFGGLTASGNDNVEAMGNAQLGDVADAFGFGGLGRIGVNQTGGSGGSGIGSTCDDSCEVGGLGYGFGTGAGIALRRGQPDFRLANRVTRGAPRITAAGPMVCNLQNPDALRRVIHRHMPEVQHCYQQSLARNPDTAGRVTVRFVIGTDGTVLGSSAIDNTTQDQALGQCVADAFRRWQFVSSDGIVTANYPIMLRVD